MKSEYVSKTPFVCLLLVGWLGLIGPLVAADAPEKPAVLELDAQNPSGEVTANDLVLQLGAEEFPQRQTAERELAALEMMAQEALLDGLKSEDPEIRRACQRILTEVLEKDFQRRLAVFAADKSGKHDHDLPGWSRYRQIAGTDKEARELFTEMLRAEAGLLESVEAGATDGVKLRLREVYAMTYNRNTRERKKPPRGTMAALVFACSDPERTIPEEVLVRSNLYSLISQGDFAVSLQKGPLQRPARAVLAEWVRVPSTQKLTQQKLRFAVMYGLKEAGLDLALQALKEKKNALATAVASAAEALGRLGGKPYAAILAELLEDERVCSRRVVVRNGKRENIEIQIRDVALVWLVHVTQQDFNTYGQTKAKQYMDMLKRYPTQAFNFTNLAFDKPEQRDKALAKWNEWVKSHPLPEAPRREPRQPAPGNTEKVAVVAAKPIVPDLNSGLDLQPLELEMADRLQVRELIRAQKLIDQGTFAEATTNLGDILTASGDYFFRAAPNLTLFKQLKAEAERLLGNLPERGREAYELQYGPRARRDLDLAIESGDMQSVARVDRGFFYTPAGAEASFLLGSYHRIGGRFTQAAMYFERLRILSPWAEKFEPSLSLQQAVCWYRSGFEDKAGELVTQLLEQRPDVAAMIAGPQASRGDIEKILFGAEGEQTLAAATQLIEWVLFRGDLTGNGIVGRGSPYLKTLHDESLTEDSNLDATLKEIKKTWKADRRTALPIIHPLVVDGAIVYRTPLAIRAVDLSTNELRWQAPALNGLWHLVRYGKSDDWQNQKSYVTDGLRRRLSEEPSFGTLSSNGRLVFAVVDEGFALGPDYRPAIVRPDGHRQVDAGNLRGFNRLAAYDARSGKLVWELGGPPKTQDTSLTGGRFSGPPLPLGDQLYAVVDFDFQTQLVSVDAASGTLQQAWLLDTRSDEGTLTQMIPFVGSQPRQPGRGGGGVSPVFGGGLLICRTPGNRYVAVDLASRSVRWSFEPPTKDVPSRANIFILQQRGMLKKTQGRSDQWTDAGALIAEDRVLLTPTGADEIFCLSLTDGSLLWSAPREDGLYLAGVTGGLAVVVGRQAVSARRLSDGKSGWPGGPAMLPQGASPTGRGYLTEAELHVPLSSAEVVAVDLHEGRIVSTSQSPDGTVPENLVKVGDHVVSVGLAGMRKFETLDARAQRLAVADSTSPGGTQAAVERAELLLYQGQLEESLKLLREARKAINSPRLVALLCEATVQALRAGLPGAEEIATEVETSIDDPALKGRLLERLATAYQETGMARAAFFCCLKLVDSSADGEQLVDVSAAHTVRRSRRVQGMLASLVDAADAELRADFDREIIERLHDNASLRMLEYFDFHPAAAAARLQVARTLQGKQRELEAELLLRPVLRSGVEAERATATAQLGDLLRAKGKSLEAARCFARLAGPWKDTVLLDGKNGGQTVAALPADDPARRVLEDAHLWPVGKVEKQVTKRDAKKPVSVTYAVPLLLSSDGDPLAPRLSVDVNSQQRKLIGYDAMGVESWQTELTADKNVNAFALQNYFLMEGRQAGHLLVVWSGQKVAAIDTLNKGKVLWVRDATKVDSRNIWMAPFAQLRLQFGVQGWARRGELPQPLVVTPNYVSFQQDRILVALDPSTGETLWIRDDFTRGSDLFGDQQRLVITPPSGTEATIVSAIDGRTLGKRKVPDRQNRLGTFGSAMIAWETGDDGATLKLIDPWQENTVWTREFDKTAKAWLIDGEQIGVLDAEGKFVVLTIGTGEAVLEASVAAIADLENVFVMRNDRRYILIANGPLPKEEGPVTSNRLPIGFINVQGHVYSFDAETGKQLWKTDIANQWFRVNYPCHAPLLTFFKRYQKRVKVNNNSWRSDRPTVFVDCVDSRTGEKLHSSKVPNSYDQSYNLTVDSAKHKVSVETRLETVDFAFAE